MHLPLLKIYSIFRLVRGSQELETPGVCKIPCVIMEWAAWLKNARCNTTGNTTLLSGMLSIGTAVSQWGTPNVLWGHMAVDKLPRYTSRITWEAVEFNLHDNYAGKGRHLSTPISFQRHFLLCSCSFPPPPHHHNLPTIHGNLPATCTRP
jgi:hypothetical protein